MLVCTGFGMISSDSAQAAFVQELAPSPNLPANFIAYDTAWNEAGTMAVVVGFDQDASPETNAYAYYPANNSYWPIDNGGWNQQRLHAVDYFREPVYDWPSVLLVNADYNEDNLINFYENVFAGCQAYAHTWEVWESGSVKDGKPTAADMAPYDLVVWIPSRYMGGLMGGGDALNYADTQEIAQYLDGGGNFFLANLAFSDWHNFGTPGDFTYNYLAINFVSDYYSNYENGAQPYPGDSVFGSLGFGFQDWWSYGWSGQSSMTDLLINWGGSNCFQCANPGSFYETTGVRYDSGAFKTIYFGFPLETLYVEYATDLMQLALDWMTNPVYIDQKNEYMGSNGYVDVGTGSPLRNPWAQEFVPTADHITRVEFYMYQLWESSEFFNIAIYNDDGFNSPDYAGVVLASGSIPSGAIPIMTAAWVECDFGTGASLTPGIPYWIVCTRSGFYDTQNWMVDYAQSYPQGEVKSYNGGIWNSHPFDFLFRTYPQAGSGGTPQTVVLTPSKDTTIYTYNDIYANGAGEFLLAGNDWLADYTRTLIEFNIASYIPKYSTITSVSLQLYCCDWDDSPSYDMWLHPVTSEWGEAGSDAPDDENPGVPAEMGDATFTYRFYNSDSWGSYGGDFGPMSTSTPVGMEGWYTWNGGTMKEEVQSWVDQPGNNHGWIIFSQISMGSTKWFYSKDSANSMYWPKLTVTYSEPAIIGYRDVFWIAGDTQGPTPPATAYRLVPSKGLNLIPMNDASTGQYFGVAVDDIGNPLFTGQGNQYMYYYDGTGWVYIDADFGSLASYGFYGIDFNPNDRRFYATGPDFVFYTDSVPLVSGESHCHQFNHFPQYGGVFFSDLAWNELYDYGLVGGNGYLLKIWPYDEYGNGTIRYKVENVNFNEVYRDISWDSDGWNEAGIVGTYSTSKMYWRYYNSNPQLIEGYNGLAGTYYTCAFKPPSSPKWLFIPHAMGSIRINIEEKDESTELIVSANFPHIFTMGMWKQNDAGHIPMFGTQVEADSTYTIFLECNYTLGGVDQWDTSLGLYLQGWYDFGNVGGASVPGDPAWGMDMYRVRQFNISYFPATASATMNYPAQIGSVAEFAIHSVWEDPINYGADLSHYRIYINVTFGPQTEMAPGDGMWNSGNSWDRNSLNDPHTWDLKALAYDMVLPESQNCSYAEFGVQRYASLLVSGNPSGSIPPGSSAILATPTLITYSSNMPYQLNVSIPNLYLNGDIASPHLIPANAVSVMNEQGDDDNFNSDIWDWRTFNNPNDAWCIWGLESGTYMSMPGHGTVTAGPYDTDFTYAQVSLPFEPTPVRWQVVVPGGTAEGVYRGTITITLWSY